LQTKYRLIILSNIDDDLIEYSAKLLDVDFDEIFTAQQIGAYKPSLRNFQYLIKNAGVPQDQVLYVAQSLFHDIAPAKQLGFSTVWLNRRKDMEGFGATPPAETEPDLEVADMKKLAFLAGVI
ncbi:MAG: HAD-IA family hydrolase, partial [Bacteroidales bacterium]|nr:HAD-IA family hydrolase [Bacteroidales bacterium]